MQKTGGAHGWVNQLAADSGVKRQTLSAWMGDRTRPDLESLDAVAGVLGVRPYEIVAVMDGDEPVVRIDDELRVQLRAEMEALLDERLGPPRAPRARGAA